MSRASKAARRSRSQPGRAGATLDSSQMLRRAEGAVASGEIDTACQILSQTRDVGSTPQGRELLVAAFTAQTYERWDRPARALTSLERVLDVVPTDAELRRLRGTLLRRAGRLRAALADLDQAHRLAPGDASIALEAFLTHVAAGEHGRGLDALASSVGPAAADLAAALLATTAGDLSRAERSLARTSQPLARLMRAIVLLARGDGHAGLPGLKQSAADDSLPRLARAYASLYLGLALARRRELQPTAQALEEALDLGLPGELVRDHLAWAYNQLVIDAVLDHDLARATDWLTKLIEVGGSTAEAARENVVYALRLYGQEKARAGDYDEAARHWARALEMEPRDFALRQNLAVALERSGRADEAIPHWRGLVEQLAKGAPKRGKGPRAAAAAEDEALGTHVRAVAHRHLADLYLEEDDVERAIVQLERALAAVPDDADTRLQLAELLVEWGSTAKALPHLERLAADRPDSVEALLGLATAQRLLGNVRSAVQTFERAYALAPDNPVVRIGLGSHSALRALEAPAAATAEGDARRALELLPRGRVLGLAALGAIQLAQGKRREAARTFKKCVREAHDKTTAALEVGRAYWKAGERELAAEAWTEAMKRAKRSPERFSTLAVEWAKAGEVERCKECFRELIDRELESEAIAAVELIMETPQGKPFVRRVLTELIPWAPHAHARMFLAEGLLRVGDMPQARTLVNEIALESVESDDVEGITFVTSLDYQYKFKLLERRTAMAVSHWLDAHPLPV